MSEEDIKLGVDLLVAAIKKPPRYYYVDLDYLKLLKENGIYDYTKNDYFRPWPHQVKNK